jgi:hypothetical protein
MTFLAQGNANRNIEQIAQRSSIGENIFGQLAEQCGVVSLQSTSTFAAFLASVVVSLKYGSTPFFVLPNLPKIFLSWSDSAFPFVMLWTALFLIAFQQCGHEFWKPEVVSGKKFWNAVARTMIPSSNWNYSSTATLAFMFSGMFFDPFVYAKIMCVRMISWIFGQTKTFNESAVVVSRYIKGHRAFYSLRFNGKGQEKSGELLETLTDHAEGNQQPSAENRSVQVSAKVQRLVGEDTDPINPASARQSQCMTDDIVRARSNVGKARPSSSLQWLISYRRYVHPSANHLRFEHELY